MLSFFQMRKQFNKLRVSLTVDLDRKEAGVMVVYDRVIVRMESVPLHEVRTVELADAWLRRPMGERGNYVERLEWMCRTGVLTKEVA